MGSGIISGSSVVGHDEVPRGTEQGFPWIVLHGISVLEGRLVMRTPWKTDTTLSRAARDSSARAALSGATRLMVVRADSGQKVIELRDLTAQLPLLRITQPGFHDRLAQIASLKMVALPFARRRRRCTTRAATCSSTTIPSGGVTSRSRCRRLGCAGTAATSSAQGT